MIDPINSTELDGVACDHCGDDGAFAVIEGKRVPVCEWSR